MCSVQLVLSVLLKVVGYFDLSVLSMSVMGFHKKKFGWGVGGVSRALSKFLEFFFNFAKPLKGVRGCPAASRHKTCISRRSNKEPRQMLN